MIRRFKITLYPRQYPEDWLPCVIEPKIWNHKILPTPFLSISWTKTGRRGFYQTSYRKSKMKLLPVIYDWLHKKRSNKRISSSSGLRVHLFRPVSRKIEKSSRAKSQQPQKISRNSKWKVNPALQRTKIVSSKLNINLFSERDTEKISLLFQLQKNWWKFFQAILPVFHFTWRSNETVSI